MHLQAIFLLLLNCVPYQTTCLVPMRIYAAEYPSSVSLITSPSLTIFTPTPSYPSLPSQAITSSSTSPTLPAPDLPVLYTNLQGGDGQGHARRPSFEALL